MTFDEQYAQWRALEQKATQDVLKHLTDSNIFTMFDIEQGGLNRRFIVVSRNIAPELIRRYERMREALERIETILPTKPTRNDMVPLADVSRLQMIARKALAETE